MFESFSSHPPGGCSAIVLYSKCLFKQYYNVCCLFVFSMIKTCAATLITSVSVHPQTQVRVLQKYDGLKEIIPTT